MRKIILIAVAILFLSGCAVVSQGRMAKIYLEDLEEIETGITTKDEIVEKFGQPQQIVYRENNIESYVYLHGIERRVFIPFVISWGRAGGTGENLIISFQYDKVLNYEFRIDQRYLTD